MITPAKRLTYADYEKIPADGLRHEIIEGEEYVTPAPDVRHQEVVGRLFRILSEFVERNDLGKVFVAPIDVVLSAESVVQPDIVVVSKARLGIVKEKNIQGAPDLLVEVLSPSTESMDRGEKRETYEASGILEYWMVHPATRTAEVREFRSPRRVRVLQEGQSLESSLLPGLKIDLSHLFRVI